MILSTPPFNALLARTFFFTALAASSAWKLASVQLLDDVLSSGILIRPGRR